MRNKNLIIGIIALAAFIGFILIIKSPILKAKGKKPLHAAAKKDQKKAPAKKVFSKGKGGLTVRILNSKNMEVPMKIKAFKVIDGRSSVYSASSVGGRMQELAPGSYDIEVDTMPQKIFKNIKVAEAKETIENLGCVTGSLVIKTVNNKNTPFSYPLRILYPNTNEMITAYMTNRAVEIIPGSYDIEIGTLPRQYKKDVRVEAGKEVTVELGCTTGSLLVRVADENQKDVRSSVRITKKDTSEIVSSTASNKPIELGAGTYNIEILSTPRQSKKDVVIKAGEDTSFDFIVKAPPAPVRNVAPKQSVKAKQ